MDLSAIIVVIVLTALFFGAIVGLEIYSRRKEAPANETGSRAGEESPPRAVLERGVRRGVDT